MGPEAARADVADLGERRVQVVLGEVVPAEGAAELGQRPGEALRAEDRVLLGASLLVAVGNDRENSRDDEQMLGVAPPGRGPRPQLTAERPRLLERPGMGEDRVGDARAQVTAFLGVARLEDDRLALGGALQVERPDHREVLAPVVQRVLAAAVEEHAAFLVAREGVGLVGVPQPLGDLNVFERPPVTGLVVVVLVAAVVARRPGVTAGDDVPAGPAAADVVERGQPAGDVERLVVGGGDRTHQADVAGVHGDRGQQRQWLEPAEVVVRRVRGDELAVHDEDVVELRGLRLPRPGDVPADVHAGVARDLGAQPGVVLPRAADSEEDGAQLERTSRHAVRPSW